MAARVTRHVRPLVAVAAIGCAAFGVGPTLANAAPSGTGARDAHETATLSAFGFPVAKPVTKPHDPDNIDDIQRQLGQLAVRNSQYVEQFNQVRVQVERRTHDARLANAAADRAAVALQRANMAFTQVVQAQYESGGLGTASSALLASDSGGNYLDRVSTLNIVSTHEADVVSQVRRSRSAANAASARAATLLAQVTAERDAMSARHAKVTAQIAKYKTELATLTSAQQADYERAQDPAATAAAIRAVENNDIKAPSPAAKAAVEFALKQIGKPYVWGAAGPSSYDCSGLTMQAWAHAGKSLPHSAAEQYNYGTHVSRDQLQPGDLLFFYQPIGHVTIYVGDGLMVSAPTSGEDVTVVPLSAFNSDYTGATHIG